MKTKTTPAIQRYLWLFTDECGRRRISREHMSEDEAEARFGNRINANPIPLVWSRKAVEAPDDWRYSAEFWMKAREAAGSPSSTNSAL